MFATSPLAAIRSAPTITHDVPATFGRRGAEPLTFTLTYTDDVAMADVACLAAACVLVLALVPATRPDISRVVSPVPRVDQWLYRQPDPKPAGSEKPGGGGYAAHALDHGGGGGYGDPRLPAEMRRAHETLRAARGTR